MSLPGDIHIRPDVTRQHSGAVVTGGRARGERSARRGAREEKEARAEQMARLVRSAKIASGGPGIPSVFDTLASPLDGLFTRVFIFVFLPNHLLELLAERHAEGESTPVCKQGTETDSLV